MDYGSNQSKGGAARAETLSAEERSEIARKGGPARWSGITERSAITEAGNRAEATALLIRCGYRVYRPEADVDGEDLVLCTPAPERKLISVQLKSRPHVDDTRYGGRDIWMLFPSSKYNPEVPRQWYLVEHDPFFEWTKNQHNHAPKWKEMWHFPTVPMALGEFLRPYELKLSSGDYPVDIPASKF